MNTRGAELGTFVDWPRAANADERTQAAAIANRLLDEPYADPDDDVRVLARQFERSQEQIARLRAQRIDALWWSWMIFEEDRSMPDARGRSLVVDKLLELGVIP